MESESITFGYLRKRDIVYTAGERFLKIHVICNNGVSETYNIYCNFNGNVERYYERICNMIDNKIRNHPRMNYLLCTIKSGINNTKYIELDENPNTIEFCGFIAENQISRGDCFEFINSILHY